MSAMVAVAVIHGIASSVRKKPQISSVRTFSDGLYRGLRRRLGGKKMDAAIAWREIFWEDILGERQDAYMAAVAPKVRYDAVRGFFVRSIADAAAFQHKKTALGEMSEGEDAQYLVEARIRATIADLERDTSEGTPLVILAHSFGGTLMSNYIWDAQKGRFDLPTPFQQMRTVTRLVTFGCNLPLFSFHRPPEDVYPIAYPGDALAPGDQKRPWWVNFYDRDDVLGFPLAPIGPRYLELQKSGALRDEIIGVGGLLRSWNPLSHNRYWTDRDFLKPVAAMLREHIEG